MTTTISADQAEDLFCGDDGDQVDSWTRITEIAHEARRWMQGHQALADLFAKTGYVV